MKNLIFIAIILWLTSCAQVVAPTGGQKDVTPPEIISIYPPNSSINFNASSVEIEFDEYIKLNKIDEQLLISPPLKYKLVTKIKGKSLILELKDTLLENTTYVLNFGNTIVDINEGNKLENFNYVFSTGNEIDSLTVSGKVVDAFSLKAEEEVLVMLYKTPIEDSTPYFKLPNYISRTDKNGDFKLTNIGSGTYQLIALADANKNYLYDQPTEKIGFNSDLIELKKAISDIRIHIFEESYENQFVKKKTENGPILLLKFNQPLDEFKYVGLDTLVEELLLDFHIETNKDTARFWWKEIDGFKTKLILSDGKSFNDTLKIKIDSLFSKAKLKLETNLKKKQHHFQSIVLKFNRPIKQFDTSLIQILGPDSLAINFVLKKDSTDNRLVDLKFDFNADSTYSISILPNSFIDIYDRTTDSIVSKIIFDNESDFGNLIVKVKTTSIESPQIIQLTDPKGKVIKEQILLNNEASFTYLKAGKYWLKLILDENSNKKWDAGKYLDGKQAEKTILYNEEFTIRTNWDQEIEWIIK